MIPVAVALVTVRVWRSLASISLNLIAPLTVSLVADPVVAASSVNPPESVDPATRVGASLVPVTVMVTGWSAVPPCPSDNCTA